MELCTLYLNLYIWQDDSKEMLFGGINFLTMWPHSLWKDNDIYSWLFSSWVARTHYPPHSSKGLQDYKSQNERKLSSEWEGNVLQNILSVSSPTGAHYSWVYHLKILLSLYFYTLLTFNLPDWKKKHHRYSLESNSYLIISCKTKSKHDLIWINTVKILH